MYIIRSMSKIINFFGGPGIGKSTQASGLFTEMKKHHMSVEYTYEFPKEVAWEGNVSQLKDQFFITANQHRNISRLYGKVDQNDKDITWQQLQYRLQKIKIYYSTFHR